MKKSKTKKSGNWKHAGSDVLVGTASSGLKFPCQNDFVNVKTKKEFTIYTTFDTHKKLPHRVSGISQLLKLKGVSKIEK